MPGRHNQLNAALAVVILAELGYSRMQIEHAFNGQLEVMGRLESVPLGPNAPAVYIDYAHTPEAVTAAVTALREVTSGPLVVVLGAGGGRDAGKRPAMGAAAARLADHVVVTDDNPRMEDPAQIRAQVLAGARGAGGAVTEVAGRAQGIAVALALAGPGAAGSVAVLGKGHEQGQEIAGTTHPFNDREAVRQAWRRLSGSAPPEAAASDAGGPG